MKLFLIFVILCCFAVGNHTASIGGSAIDSAVDDKKIEVSEFKVDICWE